MRNFKVTLFLVLSLVSVNSLASDEPHCLLVTDSQNGKILIQEGNCDVASSPCSTFKVTLSLIGFDSGILKDPLHPVWKYQEKYEASMDIWKEPHQPTSWIQNSCVWYSQELTQKLGMKRFKNYINRLHYGNQDLSGDPGKNNGLTHSWLGSSLKITPQEQVQFLTQLIQGKLPVSQKAHTLTRKVLWVEDLPQGWKLFGKTGTCYQLNSDGSKNKDLQYGWFVGWLSKGSQQRVFAYRIFDTQPESTYAGKRAKEQFKKMISSKDLLGNLPHLPQSKY